MPVYPTQTITYTLTASGYGQTVTCSKIITVIPTTIPNPVCSNLTASPSSFGNGGGSTILSWNTSNATNVTIDQGVGTVAANGSTQPISVVSSKIFTLTATGNGKSVQCTVPVVVAPQNTNLSCDSFNASPASFGQGGGTTQLTWNTTGATSVSIDQGIGGQPVDRNISVFVPDSRTYTLTASNGQNTITCLTSVSVDHGGGGGGGGGGHTSRPSCDNFRTSSREISAGDAATLGWTTTRAYSLRLNDNHGNEVFNTSDKSDVNNGSIVVHPKNDTIYTLHLTDREDKTDSCEVRVDVVGERLVVTSVRDRQPVTTISFRQVPYTGFDAGPMLAGTFYALLALWALVASYIIVVKKGSVLGFSLATVGGARIVHEVTTPAAVVARATAFAPTNLPVAIDEDEEEEVTEDEDNIAEEEVDSEEAHAALENRAFAAGMILSKDAVAIVERAGQNIAERLTILDAVIARAKESFPREDGWIALDKGRIQTLFN